MGWPTSYAISYADEAGVEQEQVVRAGAKRSAIERFVAQHPGVKVDSARVRIASRWPLVPPSSGSEHHAHAWFAGFLQETDSAGRPDWSREPRTAFAVLVEFGGSGGRVTGPLGKRIAEVLPLILGPELDIDAADVAGAYP